MAIFPCNCMHVIDHFNFDTSLLYSPATTSFAIGSSRCFHSDRRRRSPSHSVGGGASLRQLLMRRFQLGRSTSRHRPIEGRPRVASHHGAARLGHRRRGGRRCPKVQGSKQPLPNDQSQVEQKRSTRQLRRDFASRRRRILRRVEIPQRETHRRRQLLVPHSNQRLAG